MANYEAFELTVRQTRAAELDEATIALIFAERSTAAPAGGILALNQDQAPNTQTEV